MRLLLAALPGLFTAAMVHAQTPVYHMVIADEGSAYGVVDGSIVRTGPIVQATILVRILEPDVEEVKGGTVETNLTLARIELDCETQHLRVLDGTLYDTSFNVIKKSASSPDAVEIDQDVLGEVILAAHLCQSAERRMEMALRSYTSLAEFDQAAARTLARQEDAERD